MENDTLKVLKDEENEDGNQTVDPEEPSNPTDPSDPENPDNPDGPDNPENPDNPDESPGGDYWKKNFTYPGIPNFYDRVRLSLGSAASGITDEQIDYPEYAPSAENAMRSRVPGWEELDEFNSSLYQTGIVYMTCYSLCFVVNSSGRVVSQKTPALEIKFGSVNLPERPCDRYLMLVDDIVSKINGEERHAMLGFEVTPSPAPCCDKLLFWGRHSKPLWSD